MLQVCREDKVDYELYYERLQNNSFVHIDSEEVQGVIKDLGVKEFTLAKLCRDYISDHGLVGCKSLDKPIVFKYLRDYEKVPDRKLKKRDKGQMIDSLDADKVLKPLMNEGYAVDFLDLYISYGSMKSLRSRMATMYQERLAKQVGESEEGKPLYMLSYTTGEKENLRFYPKNYNVIGISKAHSHIITAPKGYVIVSGDFPQADLKSALNLMILNDKNREFFKKYPDNYEGLARVVEMNKGVANEHFNLEDFKEHRSVFKVNSLAPLYGGTHGSSPLAQRFMTDLGKFYRSCPRYAEFLSRVKSRVRVGLPIPIKSYFGYEQIIELTHATKSKAESNPEFKALNTPFQTCTSELIIIVSNAILDRFYSLGYTEDDIKLYFTRHDEPLFLMKEELMRDSWVFGDCSEIQVDDWLPFTVEYSFYRKYTLNDEELQYKYAKSCKENSHRYHLLDENKIKHHEYMPLDKTDEVALNIVEVAGGLLVIYFNTLTYEYDYAFVKDSAPKDIFNMVLRKLINRGDYYKNNQVSAVLIENSFMEGMNHFNSVFFKYRKVFYRFDSMVGFLSVYLEWKFCKKFNIETTIPDDSFDNRRSFLNEIKKINFFTE